ncbi:MAG: hypothetical protein IKV03_02475 [Alphaproteobacteria bacterium]|nr:hypothetical protein [Alphaproteobacteria bacterium]
MAENRNLSSSEQYIKKSNLKMFLIGLGLFLAFLISYALIPSETKEVKPEKEHSFIVDPEFVRDPNASNTDALPGEGGAKLVPNPDKVEMNNVVLGSKAEALIVLTAQNAPILIRGWDLAETQQDGFKIETTCVLDKPLPKDASCNLKVLWNPVELRHITNMLTIRWRIDSAAIFHEETTKISLSAQSTDSKDCVICETAASEANKKARMAMMLNGELAEIDDDGTFVLNGKKYHETENGLILDENGKIVGVNEPERIPLDLNHKIIGTISKTQDVIDANGETVGRLLGDGTIVSSSDLTVLGAAIPVLSVMDEQGIVIGKLLKNGTVVDAQNTVIGYPLVDGTVADKQGNILGTLRPWGLVIDFNSTVIGGVLPDGNVLGNGGGNIARISPTGLAVDATGELIGGVVPQGIAAGAGCNTIGTVLQNGTVKDSFEQIVGHVTVDGSVLDKDGNDLGAVVEQGLVINEKGIILGFVNSEGKAVNAQGKVIGCVSADGTVSAGKKPIGAVMAKGRVIGSGCRVLGSVYPNATVMSTTGDVLGKVRADKYAIGSSNRVMGVVIPRGTAIAEGCRLLGLISPSGRVLDTTGTDIGCVTPEKTVVNEQNVVIGGINGRGVIVNDEGQVVGRARIDGKVVDKNGKVIGCLNPDGTAVDLEGRPLGTLLDTSSNGGVVLDGDGNPTGWTIVGNEVFDASGNKVGTILADGRVVDDKGNIVAFIPPEGVIFSPEGLVLGRYSRQVGAGINMAGDKFAKILPDMTAVSGDKNEIIGTLIADKTAFMGMDGHLIGIMQVDGVLNDASGTLAGAIRADGSVVDKSGRIIGVKIPQGTVVSATGSVIGTVSGKGEVLSEAKTAIGRVLGNGLAVSNNGAVIGGVLSDIMLAMGTDGFIGNVSPKGNVTDKNGRRLGQANAFGLILGANGEILGKTMRVGPFVDAAGNTIGWLSFKGELTGKENINGQVLMSGVAIDQNNRIIGALVPRGITVNAKGGFIGSISPNARVLGENNTVVGSVKDSQYFYSVEQKVVGQRLIPGIGLDVNGKFIGWTRYDGLIENANQAVGRVSLDGRIYAENGTIIGFYVPLGISAINDSGKTFGFVSTDGAVINTKGDVLGRAVSPDAVIQNGKWVARLLNSSFVNDFTSGTVVGQVAPNGMVADVQDAKPFGHLMMNGFAVNLAKQFAGGIINGGAPVSNSLNLLGQALSNGQIVSEGRVTGKTTATKAIFDTNNDIVGALMQPQAYIGRDGSVIGVSEGGIDVVSVSGSSVANQTFGSALTTETVWAGGKMPTGVVLTDDGFSVGVVAADGAVIADKDVVMGRVLPDGTASGIVERMTYTTMPYIGSVAIQGLPVHLDKGRVLGRTTMDGSIVDVSNKITYKMLDDGFILGTDYPIDGRVVPFGMATDHNGDELGALIGDGTVVSVGGTVKGTIASNGSVKGNHFLKIHGSLVPDGLVTNGCNVLGQTTPDGQIVNGKGTIIGHIKNDKFAVNKSGEQIGRITITGSVLSANGDFMGRSLPNGTVVDSRGDNLGCVDMKGDVLDNTGARLGCVIQRGPVISPNGKMLGRAKFDGTIVNISGVGIGKIIGDCKSAVDNDGKLMGRLVSADEEIKFNGDGTIAGTFDRGGTYYNPKGEALFKVKPNGDIVDPVTGEVIARLGDDGVIRGLDGNPIEDLNILSRPKAIVGEDGKVKYLLDRYNNLIDPETGRIIAHYDPETGTFKTATTYTVGPDGELLDEKGNKTGMKLIGNKLYGPDGELIGTVGEDGFIRDKDGNIIGFLNPDGTVTLFGKTDAGYRLLPDGTLIGPNGEVIGKLESLGNLGFLVGCDVIDKTTFKKIASVMPDGSIVDLNGELFATIASDGSLRDKNGVHAGDISGTGVNLARCGINLATLGQGSRSGLSGGASGRRIFIGQNAYTIDPNGSLVAEDGTIVGYMGQDGRPYSLANKLLTAGAGSDGSGRTRPNLSQKMVVDPTQVEQMQQVLAQKRQGMRGGIKNAIRPAGRLLARAKKKQDEHWKWGRIVSSWPVKMTNMILKDKAIPAVLVRSIDSRYADVPATAIVERHIYSEEGRNIIIPAGSRVIGKFSGDAGANHVAKLEITWERLIRPDGGAFEFSATSGDAQGRGGVAAYLDEQLLAKYGKPILSSTVTSAITYMAARYDPVTTNNQSDTTTQSDASKAAEDARETFRDNMDQIFQQLIDAATEIPPVVFVPAGTRLTIFSNEDLWLRSEEEDVRDYEEQFGPESKDARGIGSGSWVDKRGTPTEQIAAGATQGNAASDVYYNPDDAYYADGGYMDQAVYEQQMEGRGVLYGQDDVVVDQNDYVETETAQPDSVAAQSSVQPSRASDLKNRVSQPILPKSSQSSGKMF